jgi:hypothetical protein
MSNLIPEGDVDYSNFGLSFANDPQSGALLVNAEKAEEFDDRISVELEGLLFLGRLTHDCSLYGHTFTLRTLTRGERLAVSLFVQDYEDSIGLADALQTAYLAMAIQTVDGRPLSIPLESEKPEDRLRRNWQIVEKWFDPVLEALYVEYSNLAIKAQQAFLELERK